jgi:hypothetical protein
VVDKRPPFHPPSKWEKDAKGQPTEPAHGVIDSFNDKNKDKVARARAPPPPSPTPRRRVAAPLPTACRAAATAGVLAPPLVLALRPPQPPLAEVPASLVHLRPVCLSKGPRPSLRSAPCCKVPVSLLELFAANATNAYYRKVTSARTRDPAALPALDPAALP